MTHEADWGSQDMMDMQGMMEGKTMGWLWNGRGHRSRTRPRVASAVEAARLAHLSAQTTCGQMTPALSLGSAVVATEQIRWAHTASAPRNAAFETYQYEYVDEYADVHLASGDIGALIERAEQTAHDLGRSRSQMWEEALRAWLETQGEEPRATPRPWLFEARRQRVWGEIEQTLIGLRTA
ncbi:MAG: hypothetical protein ACRDID_02455 [Ktedonobacterales bacterium]|jgi:hypothetical protein